MRTSIWKYLAVLALPTLALSAGWAEQGQSPSRGVNNDSLNNRAVSNQKNDSTVPVMDFSGNPIIVTPPFNATTCPSTPGASWNDGAFFCIGNLPLTPVGNTATITDPSDGSGATGQATWQCDVNGAWAGAPQSSTCGAENCPATPASWSRFGNTCGANLPETAVGGSFAAFDDGSGDGLAGSANFSCNGDGTWSNPAGETCAPTSCAATTLSWSQSGRNCSAPAPATAGTASASITDNSASGGGIGNATFSCNGDGTWNLTPTSSTCNLAPTPPPTPAPTPPPWPGSCLDRNNNYNTYYGGAYLSQPVTHRNQGKCAGLSSGGFGPGDYNDNVDYNTYWQWRCTDHNCSGSNGQPCSQGCYAWKAANAGSLRFRYRNSSGTWVNNPASVPENATVYLYADGGGGDCGLNRANHQWNDRGSASNTELVWFWAQRAGGETMTVTCTDPTGGFSSRTASLPTN